MIKVLFIVFSLFLTSCALEIEVVDISEPDISDSVTHDFLKSEVVSETVGVADGLTELFVVVRLQNQDNSLITNFTPVFNILSGTASALGCSRSDANGISTCRFRSNVVGTAEIIMANVPITLTEDIVFDPKDRSGTFLQIVSSAQHNVDAGGYSVTSKIGTAVPTKRHIVGGYEVFISTTGAITPTQ